MSYSANPSSWTVHIYDPATGNFFEKTICSPTGSSPATPHPTGYGPVPLEQRGITWQRKVVPEGARYCEELDAFVPENLPYCIRGIKQRKAPLTQRVFTRGFWRVENEDSGADRTVCAIGLTHRRMNLISLKEAQNTPWVKYRGV
ncbi:hypothetical protein B0H21DRAFT_693690 [Amylocystis lapponica]|nr:hypothetical protein B0H21DRAFT_693690 [Amylocystis lapponica]